MFTHLSSVDVSKVCGPNLILGFLLKASAKVISSPLIFLFHTSMLKATLPKDWVTANVFPAFKCDDQSIVKNCYPISLTSLAVKVIERIVYSNIVSALESNNRISLDSINISLIVSNCT